MKAFGFKPSSLALLSVIKSVAEAPSVYVITTLIVLHSNSC